jgi:hypothetical protein
VPLTGDDALGLVVVSTVLKGDGVKTVEQVVGGQIVFSWTSSSTSFGAASFYPEKTEATSFQWFKGDWLFLIIIG